MCNIVIMDRKPYVIFIPYSYPDSNHKMRGVFFKEQAAGLVKSGCDVDVVCVWAVSFREIFKFTKFIGLSERKDESGVNVWIYFFPALPQMNIFNLRISNFILKRLLKKKMQQRTLPDVLHMHVFSSGKAVREISKEYKIPYIYTEHFSIFSKTRIHSYIEHSVRDNLTYSACNTAVGHNLAQFM